ncbi:MAG TPA: ATP-binding cassette domain-containing protein, partial [Puia sp.]|nr:ATP-binding cassette domain-containing protein [Puia sp.]
MKKISEGRTGHTEVEESVGTKAPGAGFSGIGKPADSNAQSEQSSGEERWTAEETGAVKEDEYREETVCAGSGEVPDGNEPVVLIKGVHKAFKDHPVLKGVDLHVNKGENLVVLGKSGSGKSVLIKCLVGLETPDEGELCVFGHDVSSLNYKELNETRVRIGFLFQNSALYDSMTVRENLAFPLRRHKKNMSKERRETLIEEMLDNVGLPDVIDQMPSELSGGQNKRIGLARTLILRPELMLYDEPTTGLDTGTSKEISELIHSLQKKYNISS